MEDVLSTYCVCTLSAITHKPKVLGHMLIWTFFLVLKCRIRVESLSAPLSYTLYVSPMYRYRSLPSNDQIYAQEQRDLHLIPCKR
jgi:hypothetical protein